MKLTWEISELKATFLDLEIFKNTLFQNTGLLSFRTFRKAMNKFLYLPAFSSHHPATVKSWVYAEILRLRNTTLLDDDFFAAAVFFLQQLRCRRYSNKIIQSALDMLPEKLFSPISWVKKRLETALIDDSGRIFIASPPLIFRAPFARQHHIKYGPILHENFDTLATELSKGAQMSNPNPTCSQSLVMANTLAKSLSSRLVSAKLPRRDPDSKDSPKAKSHNF